MNMLLPNHSYECLVELGTGRVLPFCTEVWKWKKKVKVKLLSRVQLFMTPWIIAYQAPPSMEFSRQKYQSGDFLLQGIFRTQGSNPGLPLVSGRFTVWATREVWQAAAHRCQECPPVSPWRFPKCTPLLRGGGATLLRAPQCPFLTAVPDWGARAGGRPARVSPPHSGCRFHAGDEQDAAHHGAGRGPLHQRLRDHAHVLPLALLHPHREVRPQPQHLHQQRKLLLALLAGTTREPHLCRLSQQHGLPDRWARLPGWAHVQAGTAGVVPSALPRIAACSAMVLVLRGGGPRNFNLKAVPCLLNALEK